MQFPITIGLHRSSFLGGALLIATTLVAVVALATPYPATWRAIAVALCWAGLAGSWRYCRPSLTMLRLERAGQLSVVERGGEDFVAAELLPGATVHPWLTVFRVKTAAGHRHPVVLTVDSLSADDFRRLRLFLRWRAAFSAAGDGA